MSEERTLHAYVEGGGGLCSACGHSIGHDTHGKSMSGEPPRAEPPCEFCAKQDKEFEYLRASDTGAWQYRNKHGHWVNCPTLKAGSRPSAPTHTYVGNGEVPCFECSRPLSDEIHAAPAPPRLKPSHYHGHPDGSYSLCDCHPNENGERREAAEWEQNKAGTESLLCARATRVVSSDSGLVPPSLSNERSPEVPKPVDLQQEAREWLNENAARFWKRWPQHKAGTEFDTVAALAAFAAHLRGK